MARNFAFQKDGFGAAYEFAVRITQLAPKDLRNRAFLVQYHSASKSFELARAGAEALVADFPDEALPWVLKIQLLLAQRLREEAFATVKEALKSHPENPKLLTLARHVASLQGRAGDATEYASKLRGLAPDDYGNRAFLATVAGDFEEILLCSEELICDAPREPRGWMMKVDALVGLHRISEALETVREALDTAGRSPRLLGFARNVAFRHGRYREALDYALELRKLAPEDKKIELLVTRCMMAAGEFDALGKLLKDAGPRVFEQPLRKARRYFREYTRLQRTAPAVAAAWRAALDNVVERSVVSSGAVHQATMIQYWSQGTPPDDIQLVFSEWKDLLQRDGIGELQLYDRSSAAAWIAEHAPEFSDFFAGAFHYAMESDIFRIAFASKRPCIYLDTDGWPLEHTAEILKFALNSQKCMLYFRAQRPWVANGFFVSTPESPFFVELVSQVRQLRLEDWPRNRLTVGKTFGPARYNKVLIDLVHRSRAREVSSVEEAPGCSRLTLDGEDIYFSHEASVAAVKPPFSLNYTATGEYWKRLAGK
jgi:tetratricopeptide (TPR) repeat protein